MKKNLLILAALATAISFASCDSKKTSEEETAATTDSVAQVVEEPVAAQITDFTTQLGSYEGLIRQADGAGFVTTLVVNPDNTYALTQVADGGEGSKFEEKGTWAFDVEGQKLTLTDEANNAKSFAVSATELVMLDLEGNMPTDKTGYTLVRK